MQRSHLASLAVSLVAAALPRLAAAQQPPPAAPPGTAPPPAYGAPAPGYAPAPAPGYAAPPPAYGAPAPGYAAPPPAYGAPAPGYAPPPGYAPGATYAEPAKRQHDGFYLRMGLGAGGGGWSGTVSVDTTRSSVSVDESAAGGGLALHLGIGGSPTPGLAIGGTLWLQQIAKPTVTFNGQDYKADTDVSAGLFGVMVDWYPDPTGGFHFGGAVGAASMSVQAPSGETASERGGGGGLELGYDWWVSRTWSIGALAQAFGGKVSSTGESDTMRGFGLMFAGTYY